MNETRLRFQIYLLKSPQTVLRKKGFEILLNLAGLFIIFNPQKVTELTDVYLLLPFKKDENMFRLERNAIQRPLKLAFDDYVIKRFNIPKGTTSVMMSDLIAGPLPGTFLKIKLILL